MCWSWEVSLVFVLFQAISISYILYRNKYIDRWYALVCAPFMSQEICQLFEWAFGDIENALETDCSVVNLVWAKILICVAYSIPVIICIFAYKTSQFLPIAENVKLAFLWKWLLVFEALLYPILTILMLVDEECVTVGENGHQVWPPLMSPNEIEKNGVWGDTLSTIIIAVYYYPPIVLAAFLYQPLWIAWLPAVYSTISLVLLLVFIGTQAWSVWCWSCACITLWVLFYVPMTEYLIRQKNWNGKQLPDIIDNCCGRFCFNKTNDHFVRFGMLNGQGNEAQMSTEIF